MTDLELLNEHRLGSQSAFADLVRRHIGWVYGLGFRGLHDAHLAEDVAQAVFTLLHRKAPAFRNERAMVAWLHTTAWRAARVAARTRRRRIRHETAAAVQQARIMEAAQSEQRAKSASDAEDWKQLAGQLDSLIHRLSKTDSEIILLRYFRDLSYPEIAASLGTTPDAARKRLDRAVARLRELAGKNGMPISQVALATNLATQILAVPPPGLIAAATATASAATAASALAASVSPIVEGVLFMTTVTKAALAAGALAVILAAFGGTAWLLMARHSAVADAPVQSAPSQAEMADAAANSVATQAVAAPEGQLVGKVLTADGKPAAAAIVSDYGENRADRSYIVLASANTAADGSFALASPVNDKKIGGQLMADIPGVGFSRPAGIASGFAAAMRITPSTTLHLTFVGPDGAPVANLAVHPNFVRWLGGSSSASMPIAFLPDSIALRWEKRTDANGSIDFAGLPVDSVVRFQTPDERFAQISYQDETSIPSNDPAPKTIHLIAAVQAEGTVTYAGAGNAGGGIFLTAVSVSPDPRQRFDGSALTDAAGHFVIKQLAPAHYIVTVESQLPNWVAAAAEVDLGHGSLANANLTLVHGGFLTGKVRDAQTGEGFPNLFVGVHGPAHPESSAEIQSTKTDAEGVFKVRVPPGAQMVYLAQDPPAGYVLPPPPEENSFHPVGGDIPGQMKLNVDVAEGQTVTANFDLLPDIAPMVQGRAVDADGNALAGATILYDEPAKSGRAGQLGSQFATTDANGEFKIRAAVGTMLRARFKDLATESAVRTQASKRNYTLQLAANMKFQLVARVVDQDGAAVPDSTIAIMANTSVINFADPHQTDAGGAATFDSLDIDTPWVVIVSAPGYGRDQFVVTKPGAALPRRVEMNLKLQKADQAISGVVVDEQGNPLRGVTVSINGTKTGPLDVKTDADGRFKFAVVEGADGLVYMRDANGKSILRPSHGAKAGTTDLRLVMPTTRP